MEYIRQKKDSDKGCVFCNKSKEENNDKDNLVLLRGQESFVLMNLYPYNNGHLMVAPYKHLDTFELMSKSCMNEIMNLSTKSMEIIKKKLNSDGFNFGANKLVKQKLLSEVWLKLMMNSNIILIS